MNADSGLEAFAGGVLLGGVLFLTGLGLVALLRRLSPRLRLVLLALLGVGVVVAYMWVEYQFRLAILRVMSGV